MVGTEKAIRLSGHARQQLGFRGASEQDVIESIRTSTWEPAELGRLECRKNFAFNAEWNGKYSPRDRFVPSLWRSLMRSWFSPSKCIISKED